MNDIVSKRVLLATCAAIAVVTANPASATEADASADAAAPPAANQLNAPDIIVTAQRRSEAISKTPVTVSIVSADVLAKANIKTEDDLRTTLPGLAIRSTTDSNQINYAIRGQSRDAFSSTRPGVLPYINEVQIGGESASVFYDLQSIQALAGPQGTLFGRSATGGAVLLTTAKPTDKLEGYVSALGGTYNAAKFEGAINAPLVGDTLLARVAGFYQRRDGFQTDILTGRNIGKLDRWGVRGSLTGNYGIFHNDLVVDYFHSDSDSTNGVISGLQGGAPIPLSALYSGTTTPLQEATGIAVYQAFTGASTAAATAAYNAYFAQPDHPNVGLAGYLAEQQARGPYKIVVGGAATYFQARNVIVTNRTTVDLSDNLSLRNIFGFVDIRTTFGTDRDGTPYQINDDTIAPQVLNTRSISEELQLQGKGLSDKLKYVVGGYYSSDNQHQIVRAIVFDILFGGVPPTAAQLNTKRDNNGLSKTYAAYGQATYNLTDSLAATLGVRYTSEKVGIRFNPFDMEYDTGTLPGHSLDPSTTYNKLSWQIGLQDQVTKDLLLYAVSRRAYKSGGYNGSVGTLIGDGSVGGNGYGAERVTDAELGAKFNGRIGNVPTRLTADVYDTWDREAQRTAFVIVAGAPTAVTVNVPKAKLYGVEFAGSVQPAPWLSLGGSFNYFHAKFSGVGPGATAIAGCNGATIGVNGDDQCFDQYADTPKESGSVFADITAPVTSRIDLLLHGDVYLQSSTPISPQSSNAAGTTVGSYALTNFRVGLQDDKAGWSLIANLKNAFNRVYYLGGLPTGLIYELNYLVPGEPRTFTVEARLKF